MVSYHTPKVYRSPFGCCICKAKSSSSRFTDSSRYEGDFVACFKLEEPRYGEICNACVLLIKRWKKLPVGTQRHWNHVVDARARPRGRAHIHRPDPSAGPSGMDTDRSCRQKMKKHRYIRKMTRERSPTESEDQGFAEDRLSEASITSVPSSRAPSPSPSPSPFHPEEDIPPRFGSCRRKQQRPCRPKYKDYGEFIDYDYWKKKQVCCGFVFKGKAGEVLIDPRLFKPCCPVGGANSPPLSSPGTSSQEVMTPRSFGTLSDSGSLYEDEGLESLDETSSVDAFYGHSHLSAEDEQMETSLLQQLAAALTT